MLDQPRSAADYAIWAVALALYVSDAAKLLSARQLLLVEAGRGRLAAALSETPYTIAGRVLVFAPLLRPDRGVFVALWGRPWLADVELARTLERIEQLRTSLAAIRALVACAFALLFIGGPVLTLLLGPAAAILCAAAAIYPAIAIAIATVWWRRRRLGLTAGRAATISLEILLCPAFLPNLVRKITSSHTIEPDGAQLVVATDDAREARDEFLERLAHRTEELIEDPSVDADTARQLRSYLETVKAVR